MWMRPAANRVTAAGIAPMSMQEVFECIRNGTIRRAPEVSKDSQSLECRVERYVAGRELAVVVALCDEDPSIVLVTVFLVS